jgi:hypothetical protein
VTRAVLLVLALVHLGATPGPRRGEIAPVVLPPSAPSEFAAWATSAGRAGAAATLLCRDFAEGALLCFSRVADGRREMLTAADGIELDGAEASGRGSSDDAVATLERVLVEGKVYWARRQGDDRDHVPALFPAELSARVGADVRVAFPARSLFLAWAGGDAELDKMVAVGVLKAFQTLDQPVSPLVYTWREGAWRTFASARDTAGR